MTKIDISELMDQVQKLDKSLAIIDEILLALMHFYEFVLYLLQLVGGLLELSHGRLERRLRALERACFAQPGRRLAGIRTEPCEVGDAYPLEACVVRNSNTRYHPSCFV